MENKQFDVATHLIKSTPGYTNHYVRRESSRSVTVRDFLIRTRPQGASSFVLFPGEGRKSL